MDKKSRTVLAVLLGLCVIVLGAGAYFSNRPTAIIGGADGPTAIFIAGKVGPDPFLTAAAVLAGAALGYFIIVKRRNKR